MKRYTLEVIIEEGNDEFWERLGGTGCDEIKDWVQSQLEYGGGLVCSGSYQNCSVIIKKFEVIE
jgi:hypothetical protein